MDAPRDWERGDQGAHPKKTPGALVAHCEGLIVEYRTANGGLVIGHPLPQHRVVHAAPVQELMNLTQASESERSTPPVTQQSCPGIRHHLHHVIPAPVRDDAGRNGLRSCSVLQLPRRHVS